MLAIVVICVTLAVLAVFCVLGGLLERSLMRKSRTSPTKASPGTLLLQFLAFVLLFYATWLAGVIAADSFFGEPLSLDQFLRPGVFTTPAPYRRTVSSYLGMFIGGLAFIPLALLIDRTPRLLIDRYFSLFVLHMVIISSVALGRGEMHVPFPGSAVIAAQFALEWVVQWPVAFAIDQISVRI